MGLPLASVPVRGPFEAVLFDLDDTLMDHRGAARTALHDWAFGHGLRDSATMLEQRWQQLEEFHYRRYQLREVTRTEQRRARVREFFPHLDLAEDRLADETFAGYFERYESAWREFPDARHAVVRARDAGLRVGILTNGLLADQSRKVAATGLADLNLPLIASSTLRAAKPDPEAFLEASDRLGVAPVRCLMIGDSIVNDVRGALAAGLGTILLDRYERHFTEPCVTIRGLDAVVF